MHNKNSIFFIWPVIMRFIITRKVVDLQRHITTNFCKTISWQVLLMSNMVFYFFVTIRKFPFLCLCVMFIR